MGRSVQRVEARAEARLEVTVIVPVYNAGRWLDGCLDSIRAQTLRRIEIVCVDDGSTDGSARILASHAALDGRVRIITRPNGGVASARNAAIEAARGEWLMMVDADDHIDPDSCRAALAAARRHSADVVMWPYIRERPDGGRAVRRLMNGERVMRGPDARTIHRRMVGPVGAELRDPTALHAWGTVWAKLYRRDIVADTRFTSTSIVGSAEDALFNVEVFARVGTVVHIDRPMYHYRKSPSTFTGGFNPDLAVGWTRLHALMAALIEGRGHDFQKALDSRKALSLIGLGINEWRSPRSFSGHLRALRATIGGDDFRRAVRRLPLWRLPLHWAVFFGAARLRLTLVVACLLKFLFHALG